MGRSPSSPSSPSSRGIAEPKTGSFREETVVYRDLSLLPDDGDDARCRRSRRSPIGIPPLASRASGLEKLALKVVQERVHHLGAGVVCNLGGLPLHVAHKSLEVVAGVGDAHDAYGCSLPKVGAVYLSHGNVERIA